MAEELPPLTLQGLEQDLANPNFMAYVYIGGNNDNAWHLAKAAQKLVAAVRVYVITSRPVADQFRTKFGIEPQYVGVVFGWLLDVQVKLTQQEANDFLTLTNAMSNV